MTPRIGITSALGRPAWGPNGSTWLNYASVVEKAGGKPVHLDDATRGRERTVLADLDGLVFTGGGDVHLDHYPNPPDLGGRSVDETMRLHRMTPEAQRDAYEIPLLREALQRDVPILGICRGCQVLNVALGGRLILDIEIETGTPLQHRANGDGRSPRHAVHIRHDSILAGVLPDHVRECNSRHHQAVKVDEAFTARIAAVSPEDGLVEAIEVTGRRWAVGVQWHPEYAGDPDIQEMYAPLLRAFVAAALR